MADEKKTVELPRPEGPDTRPTVEVATLPIIYSELKQLRQEGRERGERSEVRQDRMEAAIIDLALQVQSNYDSHGGKIRALESRSDSLERRADTLERDAKNLKVEISSLKGSTTEAVERQISLTEEQMEKKLAAEATEREHVNDRIAPVETKVDMLSSMLVQGLGLRPPPIPNADGSLPPTSKRKKGEPKNAIEKQTFWTRIAAIMGGVVVTAGALDKMGVVDEMGKLFAKIWGH